MTLRVFTRFRVMPHCFCTFSYVFAKNMRFNLLSANSFCTNLVNGGRFRAFFAIKQDIVCFFADFLWIPKKIFGKFGIFVFCCPKFRFSHSVSLHNFDCLLSAILTIPSICFPKARQKMHVIFKIEQFLLFIYCSQFVRIVGKGKACAFQYLYI